VKTPANKKTRIQPKISSTIANELKRHARLRNVAENAIVEAALRTFLSQTEHEAVIDRRLNSMQRQIEKLAQEQQIVLETVANLAKVYLIHTPEIPLEQKKYAEEHGAERFEKFVNLISRALANKHLFREAIDERVMEARDFAVFGKQSEEADDEPYEA